MIRFCLLASMLALLCLSPAHAASASSRQSGLTAYSDLYGKDCHPVERTVRAASRLCRGVAGYALMVYDNDDRSSVDIVTPGNALYPLSYWDVVAPGHFTVGQKAEWLMEQRKGKRLPAALLVRLTRLDTGTPGQMIAVARIHRDGACVVYRGELLDAASEAAARRAALDPASKCLGIHGGD